MARFRPRRSRHCRELRLNVDHVEAYLAALSIALRKQGVANLRMVEEARGHLADAVEQGIERGLDENSAQHEAIAQFGSAESVAATFVAETYGMFDRFVLLAGIMMGIAIAYVDSRPTWDDTGVTACALMVAGGVCGLVAPRRPWRYALAVGVWIAVFALSRSASAAALVMLIVVMFPLAGAYAGAAMRRAVLRTSESSVARYQEFHDKSGPFHFVVMSKRGWINPELAAIVADPDTQLIPFLERMAPATLGPLGKADSVTSLDDDTKATQVRKFQVVFGGEKKVICKIEIAGGGKKVSIHWSRAGN